MRSAITTPAKDLKIFNQTLRIDANNQSEKNHEKKRFGKEK